MAVSLIYFVVFVQFLTSIRGNCIYNTASATCSCEEEDRLTITEPVNLLELKSETCNCIIEFSYDPPIVTNTYNRFCKWQCYNKTCGKW